MSRKAVTLFLVAAVLCVLYLGGCKGSSTDTQTEQDAVKTEAEYKAQADKEITKDNMAQELEKIEKSMEQDTAQE